MPHVVQLMSPVCLQLHVRFVAVFSTRLCTSRCTNLINVKTNRGEKKKFLRILKWSVKLFSKAFEEDREGNLKYLKDIIILTLFINFRTRLECDRLV